MSWMNTVSVVVGNKTFKFDYVDDFNTRGVVVSPDTDLDDPHYYEALKVAQSGWKFAAAQATIDHYRYCSWSLKERIFTEDAKKILELADLLTQSPFDISSGLNDFISRVRDGSVNYHIHKERKLKDRPGYVYLFKAANGTYKIGRSSDPQTRVKSFQKPHECIIECAIHASDMVELELRLHDRFDLKRMTGEWFNLNDGDVAYIKSLAEAQS